MRNTTFKSISVMLTILVSPADRVFLNSWLQASLMGDSLRDEYATILTSPVSPASVKKILAALSLDVAALLVVMLSESGVLTFREAILAIEGVLVACMGHYMASPRSHSVRLLNALYDGVDWQLTSAHEASIAYSGQPCTIDVFVTVAPSVDLASLRILVCGPPFDRRSSDSIDHVLTMHAPSVSPTLRDALFVLDDGAHASSEPQFERSTVAQVHVDLASFTRCGEGGC